jgi:hypothetical protein
MDSWGTHKWVNPQGRRLCLNGQLIRGYFCLCCGRHFVVLVESGERYAAHASAFDFLRLADEATARWRQVAFTNLAKCFCPVGQKDARFVKACLARYPLGALIEDIQPKAVFIAKDAQATNRFTRNHNRCARLSIQQPHWTEP